VLGLDRCALVVTSIIIKYTTLCHKSAVCASSYLLKQFRTRQYLFINYIEVLSNYVEIKMHDINDNEVII
jgi:hypothetical protein